MNHVSHVPFRPGTEASLMKRFNEPPSTVATSSYGFHCTVRGLSFEQATVLVTDALKAEGFGVLTNIDVQATIKAKLGIDVPSYRILGACNPPLAHLALTAEPDIGLLLPCNVVLREDEDEDEDEADAVVVSFMDPVAVLQFTSNPIVAEVAQEVRQRLKKVCNVVAASGESS